MGVGRTAEILAWGDGFVLKLFNDGCPAAMAEEEARATRILHELGLPVPRVDRVIEEGRHRPERYDKEWGRRRSRVFMGLVVKRFWGH